MKKLLLIFTLFTLTCTGLQAQQGQEKLEALKIAFITRQLNLSTDEAQKFWPVYNQYTAESRKIHQEYKDKDQLEMQQKLLDLKKKYKPEFLKVISNDKFEKLLVVEDQWRDKLKQELERRRQQRQDRNK
jgi:Skp family chaperone for outer membrane proteins